jgi:hypothetical protein
MNVRYRLPFRLLKKTGQSLSDVLQLSITSLEQL